MDHSSGHDHPDLALTPTAEFRLPAGTVTLSAGKPLSPGARQ
jgi:hypothetical protein